jgi:hypothetical protein
MLFVADLIKFIQRVPYEKALEGFGDLIIGEQIITTDK